MGRLKRKHTACELAGVITWLATFKSLRELEAAITVPVWKFAAVQLAPSVSFHVSTLIASTKGAPAPVGCDAVIP